MSASKEVRNWAVDQPMSILERYLFRVAQDGIDEAGIWLTDQYNGKAA